MKYTQGMNLKKPEKTDFVEIDDINENMDTIDTEYTKLTERVQGKADLPIRAELTMTAAGWSEGQYSLESQYPSDRYDIEVEYAKTCTQEQVSAWNAALLAGSISDNILTAIGEVPTIDIPIYVTATSLAGQTAQQAQMLILGDDDTGVYANIDGSDKNVENIVNSDDELTVNNYSLEIL